MGRANIILILIIYCFSYVEYGFAGNIEKSELNWILELSENRDNVGKPKNYIESVVIKSGKDRTSVFDGNMATSWRFKRSDVAAGIAMITVSFSESIRIKRLIHFFPKNTGYGIEPEWMNITITQNGRQHEYKKKTGELSNIPLAIDETKTITIKVEKANAKGTKLLNFGDIIFISENTGPIIGIEKSEIEPLLNIADTLYLNSLLKEALQVWALCVRNWPGDKLSRLKLGYGLSEFGNFEGARSHFNIAYELNPNDPLVLLNLIELEIKGGGYGKAAELLKKVSGLETDKKQKRLINKLYFENRGAGTRLFAFISVGHDLRKAIMFAISVLFIIFIPFAVLFTHKSWGNIPAKLRYISTGVFLFCYLIVIISVCYTFLYPAPIPFPIYLNILNLLVFIGGNAFAVYGVIKWLRYYKIETNNMIQDYRNRYQDFKEKDFDDCESISEFIYSLTMKEQGDVQ